MNSLKKLIAIITVCALAACTTTDPQTGDKQMSKTAKYGIGAAITCGIVGAIASGSIGARNSALACGAIGTGVGAYMDYQEKLLREKLANTDVVVNRDGDQIKLIMPNNITFATGSAVLNNGVKNSLTDVSQVLAKYNDTSITVAGHTDNVGSVEMNQTLSVRRAQSVSNYLQGQGVSSSRISTIGYGLRKPIADNNSEAGRAKNRRVEILINPKNK